MPNPEMQSMMREMMGDMFAKMKGGEQNTAMKESSQGGSPCCETSPMTGKGLGHGEGEQTEMHEMMLNCMMPHCIEMMMPSIAKQKRADTATGLVDALVRQATQDMSESEKAAFRLAVVASVVGA